MADRPILQGVWLSRTDIVGWQVVVMDALRGSNETYTNSEPGPINQVDVELDSIGCLTSGTVKLKKPRHAVFPPYQFAMRLSLDTRSRGLVAVALGYVPPYTQDAREEYTLKLEPMDKIDAEGYYSNLGAYNTLGDEPAEWNETASTVIQRILKRYPTAMYGTDAAGRRILSRPEDGQAVNITQANFYEWKDAGYVTLPYATEARWDGGKGWAKGEYTGITRPPLTPRKAIDAGEVTFTEVVSETGPVLVNRRELVLGDCSQKSRSQRHPIVLTDPKGKYAGEYLPQRGEIDDGTDGSGDDAKPAPEPLTPIMAPGVKRRTVTARQYALVEVWNLQSWYAGSALTASDTEQLNKLADALKVAQGTYDFARQVYQNGPEVSQYHQELLTAQNNLRLAQVEAQNSGSYYEPLTAKLSSGFVLESPRDCAGRLRSKNGAFGEPAVLTGITMWVSTSPWDDAAVGYIAPDPDAPLGGSGAGIDYTDLIHPLQSEKTLKVSLATVAELDSFARGTPYQQEGLTIPPEYFRSSQEAALAALMDAQWASKNEDEELAWQKKGYTTITAAEGDDPLSHKIPANAGQSGIDTKATMVNWVKALQKYSKNPFSKVPAIPSVFLPTIPPSDHPDNVPEGMQFENGVLTGTPTTGTHEFTVGTDKYVVLARPAPPSRSWDGKWYWYVAYWWRQTEEVSAFGAC